jgi:hypothetical protein
VAGLATAGGLLYCSAEDGTVATYSLASLRQE